MKLLRCNSCRLNSDQRLEILKSLEIGLADGKETVYAAIVLSLFNDPSGLSILRNYQKYWVASSEVEKIHVRAALILLNETVSRNFNFTNASMFIELFKEIQK